MTSRGLEDIKYLLNIFEQVIPRHIRGTCIDYGCGDGVGATIIKRRCPNFHVWGYDVDSLKIKLAQEYLNISNASNLFFTDSLKELELHKPFGSSVANFVFHENPLILNEIYSLLDSNGIICVLDYNLKGSSRRDFYKRFSLDNEKRVIEGEGFETAYKKHTAFNLKDCINLGERAGFKTNQSYVLDKYFVWIGDKN